MSLRSSPAAFQNSMLVVGFTLDRELLACETIDGKDCVVQSTLKGVDKLMTTNSKLDRKGMRK